MPSSPTDANDGSPPSAGHDDAQGSAVPGSAVPAGPATQVFIAALLCILLVSGLPTFFPAQGRLREWSDDFVDALGLWQGQWQLFAPEPDKINVRVRAYVQFADGADAVWTSPDWRRLSAWEKFRFFRQGEYFDGVRQNANRGAWPALARYVRTHVPHPKGLDVPVRRVILHRDYVVLPPPSDPLRPVSRPFPLSDTYVFHWENVRP